VLMKEAQTVRCVLCHLADPVVPRPRSARCTPRPMQRRLFLFSFSLALRPSCLPTYLVLRNFVEREAGTLCPPDGGRRRKRKEKKKKKKKKRKEKNRGTGARRRFRLSFPSPLPSISDAGNMMRRYAHIAHIAVQEVGQKRCVRSDSIPAYFLPARVRCPLPSLTLPPPLSLSLSLSLSRSLFRVLRFARAREFRSSRCFRRHALAGKSSMLAKWRVVRDASREQRAIAGNRRDVCSHEA